VTKFTQAKLEDIIGSLVSQPESLTLEYKAVLPPSRTIAKVLCAFANAHGGYLVLGVREIHGQSEVVGLSSDFQAETVSRKAVDLLSPQPAVIYRYVKHDGKTLFILAVDPSSTPIALEGQVFKRQGQDIVSDRSEYKPPKQINFPELGDLSQLLTSRDQEKTDAKRKFHEHVRCVLNIIEDLSQLLYPLSPHAVTTNKEGKILSRILFSSCADNFESYLSDLLFEIFLAKPETLKSKEEVTIEDVLKCADMQEFIETWSRRKVAKLQRGSVKGFIKETRQISDLNVLPTNDQDKIEGILQIRHLYAHRSGIVDEKFLKYHPGSFPLNSEHQMPIVSLVEQVQFLADMVEKIDHAAIVKYNLATT